MQDRSSGRQAAPRTDTGLGVHTRRRPVRRKMQSASFLCSVGIHLLVLLVLLFVLAPADYGGMGISTLVVRFDESIAEEELSVFEVTSSELLSSAGESPSLSPATISVASVLKGIGPHMAAEKAGGASSARGTFFGIEAGGHEFVYVVDTSRSMKGRRYGRATDELMRSVDQLGPHQSFYVLLFSSGVTQMFGQTELTPTPVIANRENKRRLREWLETSYDGGSTDPRKALRIALRMRPSAIFMLSDGEFNGYEQQKEQNLLGGNSDAFSIVASDPIKTPIHSIAFEDRSSRKNMKRLAEMTHGDFRFVPLENGIDPAVALSQARTAMDEGRLDETQTLLNKAVANFESEDASEVPALKIQIGAILRQLAEKGLEESDLQPVRFALSESVRADEKAELIGETQAWLANALLVSFENPNMPDERKRMLRFFTKFHGEFPEAPTAKKTRASLAVALRDSAAKLQKDGQLVPAIRDLEYVISTLPETRVTDECIAEHERIGNELLRQASEQPDSLGAARFICKLMSDLEGTNLRSKIVPALEAQTRSVLVAARDASLDQDAATRNKIFQELNEAFGEVPLLETAKLKLAKDERSAQVVMRHAFQLERSSPRAAIAKYRTLMNNYPDTVAARTAKERLRYVGIQY